MRYGLSDDMLLAMNDVFQQRSEIRQVTLFGSRALGTYRSGSDIDLAIDGETINFEHILSTQSDLESLNFLYSFDLLNLRRLTNKALRDHIRRVGIPIYNRIEVAVHG